MNKKFYALIPLVGSILASSGAYAQHEHLYDHHLEHNHEQDETVSSSKNTANLPRLEISASLPSDSLTWSLDAKNQATIGAADGADYLKNIPGFTATRQGGTNGDPLLRGMYGSRINIRTNDGAILGACGMRMDNPLSYVAPTTFDRIVVTKGPQTVKYGGGASAGTIRFERDLKHYDKPTLNADLSLLAGTNSRNDQIISTDMGNNFGYLKIDANRTESDHYKDGKGQQVHSAWEKYSSDFAVGFTPTTDTALELSYGLGDAKTAYAGRPTDGKSFKRTTYGARFEVNDVTDVWRKVEANYYYNHIDHVMSDWRRKPNTPGARNPDRRVSGVRIANTLQVNNAQAVIGMEQMSDLHRSRKIALGNKFGKNAHFENIGAFGELTFGYDQPSRTIMGLRFDQRKTKDHRQDNTNPYYGKTRTDDLTSGFVRYEQDPSADLTWYAGVGYSERAGDFWEMMSSGGYKSFAILKPEQTNQLDVGFTYKTSNLEAWVSGYVGYVQDYILISFIPSRAVDNIDVAIAGTEAGATYYFASGFNVGSTLAYSWGEKHGKGLALPNASSAMPQMPPLEVNFNGGFSNDIWQANAILQVVAHQNRIAKNQGTVVTQDLYPTPGFALVHINGSYKLTPDLTLSASVDNLFDRFYIEHLNLTGQYADDFTYVNNELVSSPGRTAWLKLNYKF